MPDYSRNRIALNVISSAIQVVIVGLVYFFVYRILIIELGVELLGVWSLIIATSSVSTLANFGFSSALVKFVAEYNARGEINAINKLLFTSIVAMILFFFLISLLVYLLAYLFIDKLVDLRYVKIALSVLPLSLISLFINSLGGILTSALEGFQRNYLRNFAYAFTSVCYLMLAVLFIPKLGLAGIALAQIVQAIMIFAISYYFIKSRCFSFSLLRWNWDQKIFRSLFNYGSKIQVISICQMLIEPVTKILISRYNGVTTLGFYEMASRLITQLRQIIVNMNQVTIPIVSHYFQTDKSAIRYVYERGLSLIIFIAFPLFAGIILFTPFLSNIWIGYIAPVFINSAYILAFSMLINILCAPAYFNSMGEGDLNGVLLMNLLIALLNIFLGIIIGSVLPVYGVISALGISTAAGSVFLIYYYQKRNNIKLRLLLKTSDYAIVLGAVIFSFLARFIFLKMCQNQGYSIESLFFFLIVYSAFFIPIAYFNRNFKLLNVFQFIKR